MRIRNSIYYTAILTLFVSAPVLAVESISQMQSLQGRVWVQRGDENIQAHSASEIHSGDAISTSDTGRLGTQLWPQVNLKLGASSKVMIISDTNEKKDASVVEKFIKLEYGVSCIEIEDLIGSPVLLQIGDRVTINFVKPVALCLSTDDDESHIQLIKGRVELKHLSNSMLIALNEPGSEISFFNGGIFKLLSASSATAQVVPKEDLQAFSKMEFLKETPKIADMKALSTTEDPVSLSKTEEPKESSSTLDLELSAKTEVPIALSITDDSNKDSKAEDPNEPSKVTVPIVLTKTEDLDEPSELEAPNESSEITVPIALMKTEDLDEPSKSVDLKVPAKTETPIALTNTEDSDESSKIKNTKELYNVYLNSSRAYETTAAVNRHLRDSGYSSFVIDEIDDQGPLFKVSVPNFETISAARGFIDKVVVSLGIHDAWIERDLKEVPKTDVPVALTKPETRKVPSKTSVPIALTKTEEQKESSNNVDLKVPSRTEVPISLSKTEDSDEPSKIKNTEELYNVYLNSSRSYETTAAVNRRLRDSGYSSFVIDDIDDQGPLFKVNVPNFETISAARGFIDKVVVSLGIHDAWIERHLKERSKTDQRKVSVKKEEPKLTSKAVVPIALTKTEERKDSSNTTDLKAPSKTEVPIALSKTEGSGEPSKIENTEEFYNVYLKSSRSYETTAAVNRRLRDSGYSSFVIDEIDNQGPLFRISVPNFETITAARGFVDKVVVSLGVHDAWIERQRAKK